MDTVPGNLLVISAPSGAGKTSLVHALVAQMDDIAVSISHTTRLCRANEKNGEDYFFVGEAKFREMVQQNEFVEHAEVFGNLYGTAHAAIQKSLDSGTDLLLEIDWQGARSICRTHPRARTIFILPPSATALRERLIGRGRDDAQVVEERMRAASNEMSHFNEYEFLLVNDDFDRTLDELSVIVRACRLNTESQRRRLSPDIENLIASEGAIC
jgi:guanylate kinase